jgi:hypothetical protein
MQCATHHTLHHFALIYICICRMCCGRRRRCPCRHRRHRVPPPSSLPPHLASAACRPRRRCRLSASGLQAATGKEWGRFLDSGTGTHSLKWIHTLPTRGWTAVTADPQFAANMQAELQLSNEERARVSGHIWFPCFKLASLILCFSVCKCFGNMVR